jgi:prevent-host-death family protein
MTTANVHQAKTNLSKLLDAAARGEKVVITRRGQGQVSSFVLTPVKQAAKKSKIFGAYKDKIILAPDYDDADAEILEMFEESINKPI